MSARFSFGCFLGRLSVTGAVGRADNARYDGGCVVALAGVLSICSGVGVTLDNLMSDRATNVHRTLLPAHRVFRPARCRPGVPGNSGQLRRPSGGFPTASPKRQDLVHRRLQADSIERLTATIVKPLRLPLDADAAVLFWRP